MQHVIARLKNKNGFGGSALVTYDHAPILFEGLLGTNKGGKMRGHLAFLPFSSKSFALTLEGETTMDQPWHEQTPKLSAGFRSDMRLSTNANAFTQVSVDPLREQIDATLVLGYRHLKLGVNWRNTIREWSASPDKLDVILSWSGRRKASEEEDMSGSWKRPNFYDLSLRISDLGNKIQGAYYHEMQFLRLFSWQDYFHHVVLGGEFTHEVLQAADTNGAIFDNYLTVGGSWLLHKGILVKAKGDTKGRFAAAVGGHLAVFPMVTATLNCGTDLVSNQTRFGFSVIVEDEE